MSLRYSRARTSSPSPSVAGSAAPTVSGSPPINVKVITRLALEGKVRKGEDGASMRMYLKMAIPVEHAKPETQIALFPEENIKILHCAVHPLDNNSAPYSFNSNTAPLLNNAARALNLPARTTQSYMSLFTLHYSQSPPSITTSRSSSSNGVGIAAVDDRFTGRITVNDYKVTFLLPKEFPSRPGFGGDSDDPSSSPLSSRRTSRRGSVGERPAYQFMAAIEIVVPLLTKPPRAPYLLSIPVPRCLSNTLHLRISPPTTNTANSQASLSSADEEGWNITCHPQLTRSASRHSRSNSYAFTQFADDESSDGSTTGTSYGEGSRLQGTFQSTDRVRIRWAHAVDLPTGAASGRRRVGVQQANGDLTATVLGKGKARDDGEEGTLVRLEYKGVCKGVWYAGVATLLGLDIGLEARECELRWPEGTEPGWTVTGEAGYTGWDAGEERTITAKKPFLYADVDQSTARNRVDSTSSTSSSLLRHPLPGSHVADFSFESMNSTPMSSTSSLPPPSPGLERSVTPNGFDVPDQMAPQPPGVPITLHVNMDDLPPNKNSNSFKFHIVGTVVVLPRLDLPTTPGRPKIPVDETSLPCFRVLATSSQALQVLVRNDAPGMALDVISGDDQGNRKQVPRGTHIRCSGEGGSRIALRALTPSELEDADTTQTPQRRRERSASRPNTPSRRMSGVSLTRDFLAVAPQQPPETPARPKRDGPLMIPHVDVRVDLASRASEARNEYAVRVVLPAPEDPDTEWLEFGLSLFGADKEATAPRSVQFACASVGGVPVAIDTAEGAVAGHDRNGTPTVNSQKWFRWVKVHTAGRSGESVRLDYVVYPPEKKDGAREGWPWDFLLLPVFTIPTGPYEVVVEKPIDASLDYRYNAFTHHQHTPSEGLRFRNGRAPAYFEPRLSLHVGSSSKTTRSRPAHLWSFLGSLLPHLLTAFLVLTLLNMRSELFDVKSRIGPGFVPTPPQEPAVTPAPEPIVETVTVVHTHYTPPPWASNEPVVPVEPAPLADAPPAPSAAIPPAPPSPSSSSPPKEPSPAPIPTPVAPTTTLSTVVLPSPTPFPPPDGTRPASPTGGLSVPIYVPFSWVPRVAWDIPTAEDMSQTVMHGLGQVWEVCRWIYHYPLPPP